MLKNVDQMSAASVEYRQSSQRIDDQGFIIDIIYCCHYIHSMATVRPFHRYRGETSIPLAMLLSILKAQIPLIAPEQMRYRVTTLPTGRTIRFYTARGLVDKPVAREGQIALYGYRHLLQILAVKYLQSHYLPLRKIRSLVENASNRDLEQLMPEISPTSWTHRGLTREDRRVAADPGPQPSATAAPATAAAVMELDAWHRLEVGPGVELHVHAAALSAENRERLRGALLRELGALRGWFDPAEEGPGLGVTAAPAAP